ncbi:ferritin-like domain-containing protein [Ephemerocybe angulata]|uniref:Ferritin-like domain-containing protein n=1 Tax=Ephemerocybe angulata TaxID=980116 RepID=A0A8H6HI66_9AGAR|nr:ferritin-like domain-containing protein [Tulosesus angulatus]
MRILNMALSMEHMVQAFYNTSFRKHSDEEFANQGYPNWVRPRYEQIKQHENEHVAFLYNAIVATGSRAIAACEYSFPDSNSREFVALSEAIEMVATSTYNGAIGQIENKDYARALASIMGVEARHAAWINSAVRKQNPWNTAFETPITMNMAFNFIGNFMMRGSCPSSNNIADMLPVGVREVSPLAIPERVRPGQAIQISYNASERAEGNDMYAAFILGTGTLYEKVWEENGQQYVMVPKEVEGKGAVYITIVQRSSEPGDGRASSSAAASSSSSASSSSGSGSGSSSSSSSAASSSASSSSNRNGGIAWSDAALAFFDSDIIAGPALVMFPFDSRGKSVAEGDDLWNWLGRQG